MGPTHAHSSLPALPPRPRDGHKGTFGTVCVVGGCLRSEHVRMIGGPSLSLLGAMRAGCGLGVLVMPEPILSHALSIAPTAVGMILDVGVDGGVEPNLAAPAIDAALDKADALVVGPGLGVGPGVDAVVLRCVAQESTPVVVDADAISALARTPKFTLDFHAPAVLTPHPGEFKRLAGALGIEGGATDDAQRPRLAEQLAQRIGCIVVLKGAATAVSDGSRTWTHNQPNPALATGGTGDVLSGVVASFIAQFAGGGKREPTLDLFDCARLGVAAHAAAARRWCEATGCDAGMLASDLLDELPAAVQGMRVTKST